MLKTPKFVTVAILLLFFGLLSTTGYAYAAPPTSLDGVGTATTCQATHCAARTLSTSHGHDVIVLVAECGFLQCNATVTSLTDSSGLTFTQRVAFASGDTLFEFFARATAPLTSDNITIVLSSHFPNVVVFAVREANAKGIFDNDPSLPTTVACPSAGSAGPCSASANTSGPGLVIASVAINDAPPCGSLAGPPPGFIHIDTAGGFMEVDYQIVAGPTNVLFSCTATDPVAVVLDAVSSHS